MPDKELAAALRRAAADGWTVTLTESGAKLTHPRAQQAVYAANVKGARGIVELEAEMSRSQRNWDIANPARAKAEALFVKPPAPTHTPAPAPAPVPDVVSVHTPPPASEYANPKVVENRFSELTDALHQITTALDNHLSRLDAQIARLDAEDAKFSRVAETVAEVMAALRMTENKPDAEPAPTAGPPVTAPTVDMVGLGERIRQRRIELGLSQREVGEAVGVSQPVVSQWEKDRCRPEIERLKPLARALKTTPRALLEGKHPAPKYAQYDGVQSIDGLS